MELRSYAKWDEIAHSQYTEELINSGFTAQELKDVSKEKDDLKKVFGEQAYFNSLLDQGELEKEVINFSKPFKLYNGTINLSI